MVASLVCPVLHLRPGRGSRRPGLDWCRRSNGERRNWLFPLGCTTVQGCWMLPMLLGVGCNWALMHTHEVNHTRLLYLKKNNATYDTCVQCFSWRFEGPKRSHGESSMCQLKTKTKTFFNKKMNRKIST